MSREDTDNMGLAARAAAGPINKTATPCYVGQFLDWLHGSVNPAEADGLRDMLRPNSGWSSSAIARAIDEDYGKTETPLVRAGVNLRNDETGRLSDGMISRHRRTLDGRGSTGCKCRIEGNA